jgi:hypothetical protein
MQLFIAQQKALRALLQVGLNLKEISENEQWHVHFYLSLEYLVVIQNSKSLFVSKFRVSVSVFAAILVKFEFLPYTITTSRTHFS